MLNKLLQFGTNNVKVRKSFSHAKATRIPTTLMAGKSAPVP
jgi:hypothetical protein